MPGFGFSLGRSRLRLGFPGSSVSVSGTLPRATIGAAYDGALTVVPAGLSVTLDPATTSALAARNISHDGFGRFTSARII